MNLTKIKILQRKGFIVTVLKFNYSCKAIVLMFSLNLYLFYCESISCSRIFYNSSLFVALYEYIYRPVLCLDWPHLNKSELCIVDN